MINAWWSNRRLAGIFCFEDIAGGDYSREMEPFRRIVQAKSGSWGDEDFPLEGGFHLGDSLLVAESLKRTESSVQSSPVPFPSATKSFSPSSRAQDSEPLNKNFFSRFHPFVMSVPILDFANFRNGAEQHRSDLAGRLTEELRIHGAVRVINHGVSVERWSYAGPEKTSKLNKVDKNREWLIAQDESVLQDLEDAKFDLQEQFDFAWDGDNEFPSKCLVESSILGFRTFI
ncbi:hypothetical protein DPV78_003636 [Talaromyces pinophilus]|nr:hypothetical protein DPV78_003636 [Talaromyces pinophilus]